MKAVRPSFASAVREEGANRSASSPRFWTWSPWSASFVAAFAAASASGLFDARSRRCLERFLEHGVVHGVHETTLERLLGADDAAGEDQLLPKPRPHTRASRCVPPQPGMMPRLTSGWPSFAPDDA